MDQNALRRELRARLEELADPAHAAGSRAFFKEAINPLGVRSKELRSVVGQQWRLVRGLPPEELLAYCDALWSSEVFEEPLVASKLCAHALPRLGEAAFPLFETWLATRVANWAHCDDLCTHCVGGLLALFPQLLERTLPWTQSPNRWLRRGAAVCCVLPARHGLYLGHVFRIADILLEDGDDLVRKGYGWALKEGSRVWPREVLEFVLNRRARMPRVALRYAIELLPVDWRKQAMQRP